MVSKIIPAVRVEIKQSTLLKGQVGVFAVRPLKKGSIIFCGEHFSKGSMIPWKEFSRFDQITKQKILDFCPATPEGFFAPHDFNYLSIAWYLNHSCNPNVGFNNQDDFVAIRNIKKGEELCWDYGYDECNPRFKMKCFCGQIDCRGYITGNDWEKLSKDKQRYFYFSPKLKQYLSKQKI